MAFDILDQPNLIQWTSHPPEFSIVEEEHAESLPADVRASLWPPYGRPTDEVTPNGTALPKGLTIRFNGLSQAAEAGQEWPYIERRFENPLDLSPYHELRFWLTSDLKADGSQEYPLYLGLGVHGATSSPTVLGWDELAWRRLIPVNRPGIWELYRLCLEDMPAPVREEMHLLRLYAVPSRRQRELTFPRPFTMQMGAIVGATLFPLQDIQEELQAWIRYYIARCLDPNPAPRIYFSDGQDEVRNTQKPSILIKPWSIEYLGERGGSVDVVDNYTVQTLHEADQVYDQYGVYARPVPGYVTMKYAVDAFTELPSPADDPLRESRRQPTPAYLLGVLLSQITANSFLWVNQTRLPICTFRPSPEELSNLVTPGRAPLFCQITAPIERGDRTYHDTVRQARLLVGVVPPQATDSNPDMTPIL